MKITPKQYALALFETVNGKDKKEIAKTVSRFAEVLVDYNHASQLERVIGHFSQIYNQRKGIVEAEIVSARPLNRKVLDELKSSLAQLSSSKQVKIKESVDENLLGGLKLKYSDRIIDYSLSGRLSAFRRKMKQ
jgi:F-type H+-transporting ATPase subunit delta